MSLFPLSRDVRLIIAVFDPENPQASQVLATTDAQLRQWVLTEEVFVTPESEMAVLVPGTGLYAVVGAAAPVTDKALALVCLPGIPGCEAHPSLQSLPHRSITDRDDFDRLITDVSEAYPGAAVVTCSW